MNYFDTINYIAVQDLTTLLIKFITIITAVFLVKVLIDQVVPKESFVANFGPVTKMIYFYMDSCPYCLEFNPEWDKIINSHRDNITFQKTKLNNGHNFVLKYDVDATPTVIAVDSKGNHIVYDGEMTEVGINKFIQDHTQLS